MGIGLTVWLNNSSFYSLCNEDAGLLESFSSCVSSFVMMARTTYIHAALLITIGISISGPCTALELSKLTVEFGMEYLLSNLSNHDGRA